MPSQLSPSIKSPELEKLAGLVAARLRQSMPPGALLSVESVSNYIDLSPAWIWRESSAGNFPRPTKIGGRTLWRRSDIDVWIETATA